MTGYNAFLRIASRSLAVLASFDLQTGSNFVHWLSVMIGEQWPVYLFVYFLKLLVFPYTQTYCVV